MAAGRRGIVHPSGDATMRSTAMTERARGAESVEVDGRTVAAHFGDAAAEYEALRSAAGIVELPWSERLRVTGGDRIGFLQGMLSNDVAGLATGAGCRALLLNEQGRALADLAVLAGDDCVALDGVGAVSVVRAALDRFIVADDVELAEGVPTRLFAVIGPEAEAVLARIGWPAPDAPYAHCPTAIPEHEPHVVRTPLPASGFACRVPASGADAAWHRLVDEGGARPVGHVAFEVLRVERGYPWHGRDVQADTLALEVPYEDAISFRKGCYLGQEVMERVSARGHVNRRLVGIAIDGDVPATGTHLFAGDRDVGWVTSAVRSWRLAGTIALAYVRREHFEPGTTLTVGDASGPAAVVRALPF